MSHRAFLAARLLCFLCIAKCVTIQANKDVLFCSVFGSVIVVHWCDSVVSYHWMCGLLCNQYWSCLAVMAVSYSADDCLYDDRSDQACWPAVCRHHSTGRAWCASRHSLALTVPSRRQRPTAGASSMPRHTSHFLSHTLISLTTSFMTLCSSFHHDICRMADTSSSWGYVLESTAYKFHVRKFTLGWIRPKCVFENAAQTSCYVCMQICCCHCVSLQIYYFTELNFTDSPCIVLISYL